MPHTHTPVVLDAATLPFVRAGELILPPSPRVAIIDEVDRAFPDAQTGGTRLVLTQSTYLVQTWIDRLADGDRLVATADRAALERAHEEGQRRDPEENRRQGCRLALMRLANGDPDGAERDFLRFASLAQLAEREDLLLEAYEVAHALLAQHPALTVHRAFLERIGAEISKSE